MTYPEKFLKGLTPHGRQKILHVVESGGYVYNEYGECCHSEEDDDGVDYSHYCTPDEIDTTTKRMMQLREEVM